MSLSNADIDYLDGSPLATSDLKDPVRQLVLPEYNPMTDGIIQYCGEIDGGNGRFIPGKFALTKLMERKYWDYHKTGWLDTEVDHWEVYDEGYVEYLVQCGNHVVYSGWLKWRENHRTCTDHGYDCKEFDDKIPPPLGDVDLSSYNPTTMEFGSRGLKVPESHILDVWKGHKITPPPYKHLGDASAGKLARPVLMVHGLNSDFQIWGVNPLLKDDGKYQRKGDREFMAARVSGYNTGSLPDALARNQNLNTNPDAINTNGIYFYQSPAQKDAEGDWTDVLPHWGISPQGSQSYALYQRLQEVLTEFYGSTIWMQNPDLKIDLVCHSQGGLIVREMLRGLQMDAARFPVGTENAANHINKVITVNTPHFGSAMAGDLAQAEADYPGLGVLLQDIENTNNGNPSNRELVSAHVDVGFYERVSAGASAGSDMNGGEVGCIVSPGVCILGSFLGGAAGAFTDVNLKITGPYLGPYTVTITKDLPGPHNPTSDKKLEGPSGFAQRISSGRDGAAHLAATDPFITELIGNNGSGFPRKPDGSLVTFLPLYSEDMRPVLANVLGQLSDGADRFCEQNSTEEGCFAMGDLFRSFVKSSEGHYDISDIDFSDELFTMLNNLQDNWLKASDVVVESKSQKFMDANAGLLPTNSSFNGYFETPRNFVLHDALAPWEALPHAGFGPKEVEIDQLSVTLGMSNPGATQQGLDLLCALSEPCSKAISTSATGSFLRTALNTLTEWVPAPAPVNENGYPVSSQQVQLTGDFAVNPIWIAKGYQGIAVKDANGTLRLVTAYQPGQGTYLWYLDDAGQAHYELLMGSEIVTQPSLKRVGSQWIVGVANYSGTAFDKPVTLEMASNAQVLVLADQGASLVAVVPGTGVATDPSTQVPPTPPVSTGLGVTKVRVYHVEARTKTETNTSRPRIVIHNISSSPLHGYKIAYYFTADPMRKPVVEIDYPQANIVTENLGGDQWRFVIDMSNASLQPDAIAPNQDGWQIRLHYADWNDWKSMRDYSSNYNIGIVKVNPKIVVYDLEGKILWGKEPPKYETQPSGIIPQAALQMSWVDTAPWELNMFKPQVTIKNVGSAAIQNYHALLYFRVPTGKTLQPPPQDWYTPESHPSVREIGNGLWELDLHFDQHILYGGQSVVEGNIGLNLTDWSAFDKTMLGLALVDQSGKVLFGSLMSAQSVPSMPSVVPSDMQVWIRNEAPTDPTIIKPRFKVKNQGSVAIRAFELNFPFTVEPVGNAVLETWYAPNCQVSLVGPTPNQVVKLQCSGLNLSPGATWPDDAGAVFGLHYSNWAPWEKSNDTFMAGIGETWTQSSSAFVSSVVGP